MTIHRLDQIVALLLVVFGAYLIWSGQQLGFMHGTTPGAGYFPALAGGLLVVLSIVNLLRSLLGREDLRSRMSRMDVVKFAAVTAAMLAFVVIVPLLGITVATMLLMAVIGLIINPSRERGFLIRLVLTSVLAPLACHLIFGTLLRVPLPSGIFGF
jgi:putative tricarboxylic transport membrane protein